MPIGGYQPHAVRMSGYRPRAGLKQQVSSKSASKIVPEVRVHPKYIDYIRDKEQSLRQKGEPSFYHFPSFGQIDQKGVPIPFGTQKKDKPYKEYPIDNLFGQNEVEDYDEKHPEENDLPKDARGDRSVYGEHPITGLPLHGPAQWYHFYKDWPEVGPKLRERLPIQFPLVGNCPLNEDELTFCRNAFGIEFIRRLGAGNYGAVWQVTRKWKEKEDYGRGRMVMRQKSYACKICNLKRILEMCDDILPLREAVSYIIKEAEITNASDFNHPNVLKSEHIFHIHDDVTGFPFVRTLMLMEICDGDLENMFGYFYWSKTLSEDEARPIMLDICQGLKYLHNKRIAHLDIKPSNVLFKIDRKSGKRVYKLSDFGLAKKFETVDTTLKYGPGTPFYQAPELDKPFKTDALKADIYSLGKCLLQMLIGRWYMAWTKPNLWPPDPDNYPPGWETDPKVLENWCQKYGLSMTVGDLYRRITQLNYKRRPTIEQVIADPWFAMDNS